MPLVFILFVLLLLALTGTLFSVIVFSGWLVVVVLGVVIVSWVLWRVFNTEVGLALLLISVGYILNQYPHQFRLPDVLTDVVLWIALGAAVIVLAIGLSKYFGFSKSVHPQPGDPDYFDWANRRGKFANPHDARE
jgi:hypothetical protein